MPMKGLVQRVTQASVTVDGTTVSTIGQGLCVLVGISRKAAPKDADYLVRKILNLRIFDDENGKRWNKSVMDKQYEVLCVSQFTLHTILKGNKPDFHDSMAPELSEPFYNQFVQQMRETYSPEKVKDGVFGANMQVQIQNDGPVTIMLESPDNLPEPKVRKWQNNKKDSAASSQGQQSERQGQTSSTSGAVGTGAAAGDS